MKLALSDTHMTGFLATRPKYSPQPLTLRRPETPKWVLCQTFKTQMAEFHQGLHCLLRQNQSSEKEMYFFIFLEITICNPSIFTMNQPDLTVVTYRRFFLPKTTLHMQPTLS